MMSTLFRAVVWCGPVAVGAGFLAGSEPMMSTLFRAVVWCGPAAVGAGFLAGAGR